MIWFNGMPFLDNKEDHTFNVPVSTVSTHRASLKTLTTTGLTVNDLELLLSSTTYSGFPIIEDSTTKILVGYIGRTELRYALDRARRDQHVPNTAKCSLNPQSNGSDIGRTPSMTPSTPGPGVSFDDFTSNASQMTLDLAKFIDTTPISVHPQLPLETCMELFKKLGPRVILVEHRGQLHGLVTVKDCLKYQLQVEAQENPKDERGIRETQDKLWGLISNVSAALGKTFGWSRIQGRLGHVRLTSMDLFSPRSETFSQGRSNSQPQTWGNGAVQSGMELQDRYT